MHTKYVCPLAFTLNGDGIKDVSSVKYLGHMLCSAKDYRDKMRKCRKLDAHGKVILRKCYYVHRQYKHYAVCYIRTRTKLCGTTLSQYS